MLKEQRAQTCKVSVEKDLSGHEWTIMDSLTPTPHSVKSWKGKSKSSECTSVPICFHCSFSVHHPKECKGILSAWHADEKIHGNHGGKNHTDEIWRNQNITRDIGHIWAHFNDNGDTNGRSSVVHHIMFVVMCELRGIYSAFHKFQNTRPRMPFLYRHTLLPSRINSLNSKAMVPTWHTLCYRHPFAPLSGSASIACSEECPSQMGLFLEELGP